MHRDDIERREIVEELPELLAAVQHMGQALANKSHGLDYHHAREFNELLHLARLKLDEIQLAAAGSGEDEDMPAIGVISSFSPRFV